jgi:hypothetical protein
MRQKAASSHQAGSVVGTISLNGNYSGTHRLENSTPGTAGSGQGQRLWLGTEKSFGRCKV